MFELKKRCMTFTEQMLSATPASYALVPLVLIGI